MSVKGFFSLFDLQVIYLKLKVKYPRFKNIIAFCLEIHLAYTLSKNINCFITHGFHRVQLRVKMAG